MNPILAVVSESSFFESTSAPGGTSVTIRWPLVGLAVGIVITAALIFLVIRRKKKG